MTDKQFLITEAQREQSLTALKEADVMLSNLNQSRHRGLEAAIAMLQSLPMVTDEPFVWLVPTEVDEELGLMFPFTQIPSDTHPDIKSMLEAFPVYLSPQTFTPITADDVTDEMLDALNANTHPASTRAEILAAAYNAVIKNRSEAK